jgi:glycosyltransferase involved in cell wall biosynthesis
MIMTSYPKISIVTPNLNGVRYLERTIQSIVNQNYPNLEYIVIDGGSSDGSVEIIEKYADKISYWESSKDNGLYHAIQKGFEKSTGDILGWINSDDIHMTKSLFTIAEIFSVNKEVHWIQGYPVVVDENDRIVFHRPAVNSKFSFYLNDFMNGSFIQQESTFWTRNLWNRTGGHVSLDYKYAGDFELWMRFFKTDILYCTHSVLGSFRYSREGQISTTNYQKYLAECTEIVEKYRQHLSTEDKTLIKKIERSRLFRKKHPFLGKLFHFDRVDVGTIDPPRIVSFNFSSYRHTVS